MFEVLNKSDDELLEECRVDVYRSSGPGGTKADTTESAVRITHKPTGVQASAQDRRSQHKNKSLALRRLRINYALKERHDIDPEQIGIPPALEEYTKSGLKINTRNRWYPFLVKLVLDVFTAYKGSVSDTAERLGVSTGRLVSFLKNDERLWRKANKLRDAFDLHRLR